MADLGILKDKLRFIWSMRVSLLSILSAGVKEHVRFPSETGEEVIRWRPSGVREVYTCRSRV